MVEAVVHPNPITELLRVSIRGLSQPATVHLYDVQGRMRGEWVVRPVAGVGQLQAPVSHLAEGLYLLQVETAEGVLSRQRVLKQR
ncbi:T9SS type A sorting domain-containing protein [Nibrella viscosa]|uniref:T9SS type A sorting domain-containing protein n=1 Tax=Nibrella viscosa TaxID=1084524 RepID=UPI0031E767FB